jgi:hypothetical protein
MERRAKRGEGTGGDGEYLAQDFASPFALGRLCSWFKTFAFVICWRGSKKS